MNIVPVENKKTIKFIVRKIGYSGENQKRITTFSRWSSIHDALQEASSQIYYHLVESEEKVDLIEIFNEDNSTEIYFSWRNYDNAGPEERM